MVLAKRSKTWASNDEYPQTKPSEARGGEVYAITKLEEVKEKLEQNLNEPSAHRQKPSRRFYVRARFWFPLGILIGVILGFVLIQPADIHDMHAQLLLYMDEYDISLTLPDIDLSRVETEWQRLRSNIPELWKLNNDGREFKVGEDIKARGLSANYPIVLVPGIVSTGLESWSTAPEYRTFFREKVWGGFNMISQVTFNRDKWISAMMLDPITGLDPPNVKVRAAEGIGAASSFIQGFWIWSKIVENLAVVNYDTNNLHLAPYDWRLSYWNLEERDGYFSRMKSTIEGLKKRQNKKVVIAAHSMGSTAKAMAAFLSGEMKDTVQMNPAGAYVLEKFFSRKERQKLFRSWAGSASLWIKGGREVWGNQTWAPDDEPNSTHTHGELIAFRQALLDMDAFAQDSKNMTADEAGTWIMERTPSSFQKMLGTNYSFDIERDEEVLKRNDIDHTKWTNPLEIRLPNAPSMKFYCVYGHGKETERSYWYAHGPHEQDENFAEAEYPMCTDPSNDSCSTPQTPLDIPLARNSWIDAEYTDENAIPKVRNGVNMGEGDGTVSLLSLGAMCVEGWKRPRWNPAGIKITTVELPHRPVSNIPRGGANTSDHVDILGSTGLNEIILKVATGVGHEIEDNYVSRIREYAQRIQWD
ncbi:hypothetical protein SERLADRAFT_447691 [Serpula lacrymans var. lacrymans S7.9]|uniref:Phospholipid:diacylglycerol acyltransferase n=1 Tax=Serpula lacrymans var. lacrymans (strain S7.9) TaxID=578457 RepID=F8NQ21_SERL9|nr:uncharacterized protein SERLADRAFT_447691 [Serpula lacrymans var. lacrymans S7.9]EGO26500.1 hypothetical protein SERLADRAFT_447691 [Serpula lacrymans var. lacrymans S7.9]